MRVYWAQTSESLDKASDERPQTTRMLGVSDYARLLAGRRDYGECIQSTDEHPSRNVQENTNPTNPDLVVVYVSLAPNTGALHTQTLSEQNPGPPEAHPTPARPPSPPTQNFSEGRAKLLRSPARNSQNPKARTSQNPSPKVLRTQPQSSQNPAQKF